MSDYYCIGARQMFPTVLSLPDAHEAFFGTVFLTHLFFPLFRFISFYFNFLFLQTDRPGDKRNSDEEWGKEKSNLRSIDDKIGCHTRHLGWHTFLHLIRSYVSTLRCRQGMSIPVPQFLTTPLKLNYCPSIGSLICRPQS